MNFELSFERFHADCDLPISSAMKSRFLLIFALLTSIGTAQAQDSYRTYRNARFGTKVTYPANLVAPRPESANGDGRKFVSDDGQIELTVYASYNVNQRTARAELARAVSDWKRDGAPGLHPPRTDLVRVVGLPRRRHFLRENAAAQRRFPHPALAISENSENQARCQRFAFGSRIFSEFQRRVV